MKGELVVTADANRRVVGDDIDVQQHSTAFLGVFPGVDVVVSVERLFGGISCDDLASDLVNLEEVFTTEIGF